MPEVLVPLASTHLPNDKTALLFARETYLEALIRHGLTPRLITPQFTPVMFREVAKKCDGLFLMGGSDVGPELYRQSPHPKTNAPEPDRDLQEIAAVAWAMTFKKPILTACRGTQVLNIAQGGDLIQHLPDVVPRESHYPTTIPTPTYDNLFIGRRHRINTVSGSIAAQIFGPVAQVNSYHHQAIGRLGRRLRVTARSPAEVIEIIEGLDPDDHFIFGAQFHPEALNSSAVSNLFALFATQVRSYHQPKISLAKS